MQRFFLSLLTVGRLTLMLFMRVAKISKAPFGWDVKGWHGFFLASPTYEIGFRGTIYCASVMEKTISSLNSTVDQIRLAFLWI